MSGYAILPFWVQRRTSVCEGSRIVERNINKDARLKI